MQVNNLMSSLAPAEPARAGRATLEPDDFFRILGAQLHAQNPLEPLEETEFMGQLAQFSQLEKTDQTNASLQAIAFLQESIAALQQMTQGAGLIGHSVEYVDSETGETRQGVVRAIRVVDGLVVADVDGASVPFPQIRAVLAPAD